MLKSKFALPIVLLLFIFSACSKEEGEKAPVPKPVITSFSFLKANNPSLNKDISLEITGNQISGQLPLSANVENLVATFNYVGSSVKINGKQQVSNNTNNDFTDTVVYTVNSSDGSTQDFVVDATWFTGLPLFKIYTQNGVAIESKEDYVSGNAALFGGRNYNDVSGEMEIKGRGHSTWFVHPKKPYQLKFENKAEVFGMPADKKWILLAEYSDKTLIRNKLAYEMGKLSYLDWTPQSVFSEVFLNDEYNGTYLVTQKVEAGSNRVNIGDDGYLLEIDVPDHLEPGDIYFNSTKFMIQIKEPEIETGSSQYNLIKNHIIEFENVLFSQNFLNPETGYKSYIDMPSFVDWYLINEIAKNQDAKSYSSIYFNYIPGGKIKMGPLWDFDLAFGNVDYSECEFPTGFWVKYHAWINRMFQDPEFVSMVKERFAFFKENENNFIDIIDKQAFALRYAQEENDNKWDLFGNYVWPNPVVYGTHEEEVQHLKTWFETRMQWMDEEFGKM